MLPSHGRLAALPPLPVPSPSAAPSLTMPSPRPSEIPCAAAAALPLPLSLPSPSAARQLPTISITLLLRLLPPSLYVSSPRLVPRVAKLGPGRPGPSASVESGDSLTQEAYLSWRELAWRTVRARAVHVGARSPIMHHSGCTSRQLMPFEIRCLRPTISRSPGDRRGPVRCLGYQLDTCPPSINNTNPATCYRQPS